MKPPKFSNIFLLCVILFLFSTAISARSHHENFLHCLSLHTENASSISKLIYTRANSSYIYVLESLAQNARFIQPTTPKPLVIITPTEVSHIQATVVCSRQYGLQIRTRSGGHDYEGLSYVAYDVPYVVIDMRNLRSIDIDVENRVAWVQVGAILGEVFYRIAEKSRTLAFPASSSPTVGVGGHFSVGGYGSLLRKYGLAADNVIDAQLVDVNGRVLDRESMGEDLFWAIRGGGGASFGVITAWKINLVPVPYNVTVCSISKTLEQNATQVVHRWQSVAPNLPKDIFIRLLVFPVNSSETGKKTLQATWATEFLGGVDELIPLMEESFPELGLAKENCNETSWIESYKTLAYYSSDDPLEVLLNRSNTTVSLFYKGKSDYVQEPIPEAAFEGIWQRLLEEDAYASILFIPYGGRMAEIPETEIPFPHRAGNLYHLTYTVSWEEEGIEVSKRHLAWARRFYDYVAPYVSKSPRSVYLGYRDLDIGRNNWKGNTSYAQASIWGIKYFHNNFKRLAQIKTKVDPGNFFKDEQSIPLISY